MSEVQNLLNCYIKKMKWNTKPQKELGIINRNWKINKSKLFEKWFNFHQVINLYSVVTL